MASSRDRRFILWFDEIGVNDVPLVGGKNALLGEIMRHLGRHGVRVPPGFTVTAQAFRHWVREAGLLSNLKQVMNGLDPGDSEDLALRAKRARDLFLRATFPSNLEGEITKAYWRLCSRAGPGAIAVAVRPSGIGGLAPVAPVALHDTFLNVKGEYAVLDACRNGFASLFTARALAEFAANRIDATSAALALGVQQMVRSDAACSGLMTGCDPRSGFSEVMVVEGSYGVRGPSAVEGAASDEFVVHKPTLRKGFRPVVSRRMGTKGWKYVPGSDPGAPLVSVSVPKGERERYILNDDEVLELARAGLAVEAHLNRTTELTWAKDGDGIKAGTGMLFVLQVRPVIPRSQPVEFTLYLADPPGEPQEMLLCGAGVGGAVGAGKVKVIGDAGRLNEFTVGSVLVTEATDPEWEQAMQVAAAVITARGDGNGHAASFCSEHAVPCLIGVGAAAGLLADGMDVTVDCRSDVGRVMKGQRSFRVEQIRPSDLPATKAALMAIGGPPTRVFFEARYPADGIGMLALDAVIEQQIGIHPLAVLDFDWLREGADQGLGDDRGAWLAAAVDAIQDRARPYGRKADWFVDRLACAVASYAAGAYREASGQVKGDVLVRLSGLSSDRYARLLGGERYEPVAGDPLRALRGAGRHCHPILGRGLSLECQAVKRVREEMGLSNVKLIAPLCRTPEEGRRLLSLLETHGLVQGENGLEVYLQVQAPSNLFLIEQFGRLFDGFIVSDEDLISLAVGVGGGGVHDDRDLFREVAAAARRFCGELLQRAKRLRPHRKVGFCLRDPEAMPSWVAFLAGMGVDFLVTRPNKLAATRLIAAYAELAGRERKQFVLAEADPVTGRETVQYGVPPGWLKDQARRWGLQAAGRVQALPVESRRKAAAFLGAMAPRVQIEQPGGGRVLFCWQAEDVDLAKEKRAKGVRSVKVRPVGTLDIQELVEISNLWSHRLRADGRKVSEMTPTKIRGLIKRFEIARAECVAHTFAGLVTELIKGEA